MKKLVVFVCLCLSIQSYGFVDPTNLKILLQNIEQTRRMVQQLREAKKQLDSMRESYSIAKLNVKKLDFRKIGELKRNLKQMHSKIKSINNISDQLSKLDKAYNDQFASGDGQSRPSEQENELTKKRIQETLKANQKAIDSLSVLESYKESNDQIERILDESSQSEGAMQAAQSTNNLLSVMAKNEQEMKLMMGRDLQQRTLALSQEQLDKDWAYNANRYFWNDKEAKDAASKNTKLPDLKETKDG